MTAQKKSEMPDQQPEKARRNSLLASSAYIGVDRIVANPDVSTDIPAIVGSIDLSEKVTHFEPVHIAEHNILLTGQPEFFQRFNDNPDIARMLFVNPVLAFREAGITMSPEVARHVLRSVYQPRRVRDRLAALETKLKDALGEAPRPHDPEWAAAFLFEKLKVSPLDTTAVDPVYLPSRGEQAIKTLNGKRPKGSSRYKIRRRPHHKMVLSGPYQSPPDIRNLDLDADLPEMKTAPETPSSVSFEELYFYKNSHELVRDALAYGILQKRGIPIHSGDSFRKIQAGEKTHLFHDWISAVRFSNKEEGNEPR